MATTELSNGLDEFFPVRSMSQPQQQILLQATYSSASRVFYVSDATAVPLLFFMPRLDE